MQDTAETPHNSKISSPKAYIAYGIMEGHMHGIKMRDELRARGFDMTNSVKEAAVVIAHSGGHLLLPKLDEATKLLLIDPSGHTGRTVVGNILRHIIFDIRHVLFSREWLFYLRKTALNLYYFLTQFRKTRAMYRSYRRSDKPGLYTRKNTIVVQGSDESWLHKADLEGARVFYVPASHDDCWLHPGPYLDLLDAK